MFKQRRNKTIKQKLNLLFAGQTRVATQTKISSKLDYIYIAYIIHIYTHNVIYNIYAHIIYVYVNRCI